jgi:hypothetical protein
MKKIFAIILLSAIFVFSQDWKIEDDGFVLEGDSVFKVNYVADYWAEGDTGMVHKKRTCTYKGTNIRLTKTKDRKFHWKPAEKIEDTTP